jgi:hypothetical protein
MKASTDRSLLAATRDHVIPRSKRGRNGVAYKTRTVPCCRLCNGLKADMLPEEWTAFMLANPEWWTRRR